MFVDVRGGNSKNKGAELMLRAVAERLSPRFELTAPPVRIDFDVACELRLRRTLPVHRSPRFSGAVSNQVPTPLLERFALVSESQIGATVNIAGYAYGDPFPAVNSKLEGIRAEVRKRRGAPTILMPQAFGPFGSAEQRDGARRLMAAADLVFARDAASKTHIDGLGIGKGVEVAPDFTIGLPALPDSETPEGPFLAIVPNMKLVEMGVRERASYVAEFASLARFTAGEGIRPLVVIHELQDAAIGEEIAAAAGCEVFSDPHPLRLKATLGAATVVVASRFHAVVSALAQGVPTAVVGWSHKYGELLNDFGVPDWQPADGESTDEALARVLRDQNGLARMLEKKSGLLAANEAMWRRIEGVLDTAQARAAGS